MNLSQIETIVKTLSEGARSLYNAALNAPTEGEVFPSDYSKWKTVYLDNIVFPFRGRVFSGYLSALESKGLYRIDDNDKAHGLFRVPDEESISARSALASLGARGTHTTPAPIFTTPFAKGGYVSAGDKITAAYEDFSITATIHRDLNADAPDQRSDGFWPSKDPDAAGYVLPENFDAEHAFATKVMEAWKKDEWQYVGVAVTVSKNGIQLTGDYDNALWDIECDYPTKDAGDDYDNSFLLKVANSLAPEALDEARSALAGLGVPRVEAPNIGPHGYKPGSYGYPFDVALRDCTFQMNTAYPRGSDRVAAIENPGALIIQPPMGKVIGLPIVDLLQSAPELEAMLEQSKKLLNAISALIDGNFDNSELVAMGALRTDKLENIQAWITDFNKGKA